METLELTVRGEGVDRLPSAIGGYQQDTRVDYEGDGFYLVVTDRWYTRTATNMQATTVFDFLDPTVCEVTILSGGGGGGLFQFDAWSESAEAKKIAGQIGDFCSENDLEVEAEGPDEWNSTTRSIYERLGSRLGR